VAENGGKVKAVGVWGITDAQALTAWRGQAVEVHMQSGEILRGALVGFSAYTMAVKVGASVVIVHKGGVAWLTAAEAVGVNGDG
jgi:sRNA-binding regulator protein Hfq